MNDDDDAEEHRIRFANNDIIIVNGLMCGSFSAYLATIVNPGFCGAVSFISFAGALAAMVGNATRQRAIRQQLENQLGDLDTFEQQNPRATIRRSGTVVIVNPTGEASFGVPQRIGTPAYPHATTGAPRSEMRDLVRESRERQQEEAFARARQVPEGQVPPLNPAYAREVILQEMRRRNNGEQM